MCRKPEGHAISKRTVCPPPARLPMLSASRAPILLREGAVHPRPVGGPAQSAREWIGAHSPESFPLTG